MNTMENEFIEERGCKGGRCRRCCPCKIIGLLLLLGTFAAALYTAIMLPKIVRSEVSREPALKAGGVENYERILNEVYNTPEYKKMMTDQLQQALAQNKAIMEMYANQSSGSTEQAPIQETTGALSGADTVTGTTVGTGN